MELRNHAQVERFLDAASPLLLADEARHNGAFGICHTLAASPETCPIFHQDVASASRSGYAFER